MKRLSFGTMSEGIDETNFIGRLNDYCQSEKLSHDYVLENKCGPSHIPLWVWLTRDTTGTAKSFVMCETKTFNPFLHRFTVRVVINKKQFPVGEGKSMKEARQKAAQLALSALNEQSKVFNIFCLDLILNKPYDELQTCSGCTCLSPNVSWESLRPDMTLNRMEGWVYSICYPASFLSSVFDISSGFGVFLMCILTGPH